MQARPSPAQAGARGQVQETLGEVPWPFPSVLRVFLLPTLTVGLT